MPVTSSVAEEHQGKGKGHVSHGNGKGLGHLKHQQDAMEDGVYEIDIFGVNHVNHSSIDQTTSPVTLADGSLLNTEVRQGSITTDSDGLHLVTDSNNGRLRLNVGLDADNQLTLGELDDLSFDYRVNSSDRTDVIPVIRLIVDTDGNLATTADRAELVFEYTYQGDGPVQSGWQTADLVGDDWTVWQRPAGGPNLDKIAYMTTFSDYADANGFTPAATGGVHIDQDDVVVGFQIALGSGNGTTDVHIDNLQVGGVTYDFIA